MTRSSKEQLLRAARATGLFRCMRWRHRHDLLVLTYHSVVDGVQEHRREHPLVYRNAVNADRFRRQMRHLRRYYNPLDGRELRAVLEGASPPDRAVVVTFDDGLLNNKTVALPILRRFRVPALFFLPTGFVDAASEGTLRRHWSEALIARLSRRAAENNFPANVLQEQLPGLDSDLNDLSTSGAILHVVDHLKGLPHSQRTDRLATLDANLGDPPPAAAFPADPSGNSILTTMNWDDARTVAESNVTLGGHTVNHESLARLPSEAAESEIKDSLDAIADRTDQHGDLFSYPYGRARDFHDGHRQVLAEAGCRGAFTQMTGFNDLTTPPLALRRIDVSPNYDLGMFTYAISGTKHIVDRLVGRR